jgi:hypothetical protein
MYRDRNLLDLARGQHCLIRKHGVCRGDSSTVVAAHSNQGAHGKGMAQKASDAFTVHACFYCHNWLDQGNAPKDEKIRAFEAAHNRQIIVWQSIANNPTANPKAIKAARAVLVHLKEEGLIA